MSGRSAVSYVTDLEGKGERFEGFVARDPGVSLEAGRLVLAEGTTLVFGGDAVDRGASSRRLLRTFLDARARYGSRVVLLAGNRDLNKLRLLTELTGSPPASTPPELAGDRVAVLRHVFARTMGAPDAFAHRATELAVEGADASDEAVVASFLDDVAPDGLLSRYLAEARLGYRHGETLFVHGALGDSSFGFVPGVERRIDDVDGFVDALDSFLRDGIRAFRERRGLGDDVLPWKALVDYQAPVPGLHENPRSVVYGRLSDAHNNPSLPPRSVMEALRRDGVHRLVVGHSPSGDLPAFLRDDDFELVVADNSRSRVASGASVVIDGERVVARGATRLDDGRAREVTTTTQLGVTTEIGRRERATGRLVKALVDDGRALTFRGLPGYVIEQVEVARDALSTLVTPSRDEALLPGG